MTSRDKVRRVISNAFYEARNDGQTMETAADRAADGVVRIIGYIQASSAVEEWETYVEEAIAATSDREDLVDALRRIVRASRKVEA